MFGEGEGVNEKYTAISELVEHAENLERELGQSWRTDRAWAGAELLDEMQKLKAEAAVLRDFLAEFVDDYKLRQRLSHPEYRAKQFNRLLRGDMLYQQACEVLKSTTAGRDLLAELLKLRKDMTDIIMVSGQSDNLESSAQSVIDGINTMRRVVEELQADKADLLARLERLEDVANAAREYLSACPPGHANELRRFVEALEVE